MKVLWLCNIMLPEIANTLNMKPVSTGGWITGLANGVLKSDSKVKLTICFPIKKENGIYGKTEKFDYYGFNSSDVRLNNRGKCEKVFENIIEKVKPDIIHIFGTEYPHTLAMVDACRKLNVLSRMIISIQGMVSVYAKHYTADLPWIHAYLFTIRDIVKKDNIYGMVKNFEKRGKLEIESIEKCKNIIGRTDWDKACTLQINSEIKYFHCNEILRDCFYVNKWELDKCEKHSIFVSQCYNPIKGFHKVIDALEILVKKYPDVQLYTTGKDIINCSRLERMKLPHYSNYLAKKIKEKNLENHVYFLGALTEQEMCVRYLKSHVFVSPSVIENSPNSVGEAMLLGVPVVSTDVGGVKNMLCHDLEGYIYPFNEYYMMAYYIQKIFENEDKTISMSNRAREHARRTHDVETNVKNTIKIYTDIINSEKE